MKLKKNRPKKQSRQSTSDEAEELGIEPVKLLSRPRSWAIYGKSGSGKTTLASTFPKPILILDIRDEGTDSIADIEEVDVKAVENWDDFEETYQFLKRNPKRYKTVVIDTVTQLQQMCMEYVMSDKKKDAARVGDWGSMTKRDWGEVSGLMKDKIIDFRNLRMEVVFLAQERVTTVEDDDDNPDNMITPTVGAHVIASVRVVLNAAVQVIGNTFIRMKHTKKEVKGKKVTKEEPQYCLRIGPNPIYDTKIRKPKSVPPPAFIENPEYPDIIEIIKGE